MHQVATAKPRPPVVEIADLRRQLTAMEAEFEAVLASNVRVDEFKRVVLNAVQENPELLAADQNSFFRACLDCARDGNVPDGKEAYFDIRNSCVKVRGREDVWVKKVVYMPMIRGFYKRAIGKSLKDWRGDVVCENDKFRLIKGDEESFIHEPDVFGVRGKIIGAYSIAVLMDGTISREFMSYADLMKAKAKSSSAHSAASPWNTWEDRMCIKTVAKRHSVRLPIGQETQDIIDRDTELDLIAQPPAAKPAAIASKKATARLTAIAAPEPAQEPQEAEEDETGRQEPEVRQPAQQRQEAPQATGKRGPGRPSNAEREAAQKASQEALQEETAKRAQPAAAKAAPTASAKSPPPSDTSQQGDGRQATATPRNGGAMTASRSEPEKTLQQQADEDQAANEDTPEAVAYRQGWAAFLADLDRKPPRALTAANRYAELDQWYEGYDAAAQDADKGESADADEYVDRVYS